MVRDHLSPRLRAEGFRGSGGGYELPSPTHWIVLGVQASQFSSADSVQFTLNCQVIRRDEWEAVRSTLAHLGAKPKPNTVAGSFVWWSRIGTLMPEAKDKWWSLDANDDLDRVAEEVADSVRKYVVPAVRREVARTQSQG